MCDLYNVIGLQYLQPSAKPNDCPENYFCKIPAPFRLHQYSELPSRLLDFSVLVDVAMRTFASVPESMRPAALAWCSFVSWRRQQKLPYDCRLSFFSSPESRAFAADHAALNRNKTKCWCHNEFRRGISGFVLRLHTDILHFQRILCSWSSTIAGQQEGGFRFFRLCNYFPIVWHDG